MQSLNKVLTTFVLAACLLVAQTTRAQINDLPRSTPEAQGISSEHVLAMLDSMMSFKGTEMHEIIVMRHGKVIAQKSALPFLPEYGNQLFSCSKTFVSAAVGLAIADNRLRLDDRLCVFFPEQLPEQVDSLLAKITVRDLLTMQSGFEADWSIRDRFPDWIRQYLKQKITSEPGTHFVYDSMDTYLLSAIVQRVTGKKVIELLNERIFGPLHITYSGWEESPDGINCGGWGLYLQCESMAKFGQLLLQKGEWDGKQLLPAWWVEQMMQTHVDKTGGDAYCYQMWRCGYPTAARADGAYGQWIIVIPDKDMVVAVTECMNHGGDKLMSYIWNGLFPYLHDEPLPESKASAKLSAKTYSLPFPRGKAKSAVLASLSGKECILDADNPMEWKSVTFHQEKGKSWVHIKDSEGRESDILLGFGKWLTDQIDILPVNSRKHVQNSLSDMPSPWLAAGAYGCEKDKINIYLHFVNCMSGVEMSINKEGQVIAEVNYLKQ